MQSLDIRDKYFITVITVSDGMNSLDTVVVGLDGAHFELLDPWIKSGELPNIEKILSTGISTDLHSVLPPVTSPNWKAYSTGKNPGKIGIFWWENIDTDNEQVYYPEHRKHTNTEYWELLAEEMSVGILGVPTTHPPKEVGEFVVAGAPDAEDTGFAYPDAVEQELCEEFDYRVILKHRLRDYPETAAEEILDLIDLRFQAAKHLAEKHDIRFLQVTTFYINSLHHYLWDDEYTLQAWQLIDKHIGDLIEAADNLILMSDHGSNQIETVFNINKWLEKEGYLSLTTGTANTLRRFGINTDRLIRLTTQLGIRRPLQRLTPQWILNQIPNEHGEFIREQKTGMVNWAETQVIASGQGPVYLTLDRNDPKYEPLRTELMERLSAVTDPSGRLIADDIMLGEDVYSGAYAMEGPDIVIDQSKGTHILGSVGSDEIFSAPKSGWVGENKKEGLFAATGPAFGNTLEEPLSILDLAPTLLHLHGFAVPTDMDGSVRTDIFAPESDADNRAVQRDSVSETEREIERIRQVARELQVSEIF